MPESNQPKLKIAYLCDRLGPYHLAQMNAANEKAAITIIEYSAKDETYAWDCIKEIGNLPRVTLFTDKPITMQSSKMVVKRLRSVLDEIKPQVVAVSGWAGSASLVAMWWCLDSKIPVIMMSDSQEYDESRVWMKEFVKKRIVRLASSGFVGGTSHIPYLKHLGIAEKNIVIGCDVVDNDYFSVGARIARQNAISLRQQFSLPENYFLVSNRFVPKKNLVTVLRAYAKYQSVAGVKAWKMVLLGDGPLKQQLLDLSAELGLTEKILMPGFKQYSELLVYYGLAGAFILASTSEQWGLVVNEAMAAGLPVIVSSRCGCAPDLVKHGENGFVFDPEDANSLAQHLRYVSSDECPRDLMGEASRKIINEWDLQLFARNLHKAAELALTETIPRLTIFDKMLLWAQIRYWQV